MELHVQVRHYRGAGNREGRRAGALSAVFLAGRLRLAALRKLKLDKPSAKFFLPCNHEAKEQGSTAIMLPGRQGPAAKYDKATLSKWAKKGGRPRKNKP